MHWGEPSAMIDACIHFMQFHIIISTIATVLSVQATVQLHER